VVCKTGIVDGTKLRLGYWYQSGDSKYVACLSSGVEKCLYVSVLCLIACVPVMDGIKAPQNEINKTQSENAVDH